MPIIDAHVHLWSHDKSRYPDIGWRTNGRSTLPEVDGSADLLVEAMNRSGVAWALNVQVPWYGEDNRYHQDVVKRFSGRFAFLAVIDLDTPGAAERLERITAEDGARGLRIHLVEQDRPAKVAAGAHDEVLAMALRLDVPVQFLGRAETMHAVRRVVGAFDGLKVVIDHQCLPDPSHAPDYAPWDDFFALADYPHSYVKVSAQSAVSKAPYPFADLHGFTERLIESFGPARCMWGSDWPLLRQNLDYEQTLAITRDHLPFLSGDDLQQVLSGTAAALWKPLGA